jgi:hypothetical protein
MNERRNRSRGFRRNTRAREAQVEHWADEILEISDDGRNDSYKDANENERVNNDHISRSRLRVDTRKWLMSKLAPKPIRRPDGD